MTTTHEIKFAGLTLQVTGFYDSGEEGSHFVPASPPSFSVEEITSGELDLTELFASHIGFVFVEDLVMVQYYS